MHTVGKVFLGLTIVAGIATMVLATKLLQKRNDITQKLDALKKQNETNATNLVAKRDELRRLRHDYEQTMANWGRYWSDRQVNVQPNGNVAINVGSNEGVGLPKTPENPVFQLYAPGEGGALVYVGPFQSEAIVEQSTTLKPTWKIRPSDLALMKPGLWRIRTLAPSAWVNHFHTLQTDLVDGDELIAAKLKNVDLQDKLIAKQNAHLEVRKEELLGYKNPAPKADTLGPEFTKGLVEALAIEDEARNAELAVVDDLRRRVQAEFRREQSLIAHNRRLAASLPGARPATAEPTESASAAKSNAGAKTSR